MPNTSERNEIPQSWSLCGKVAIVTGAARGIGRETVKLLRQRGVSVVATDKNPSVHDLAGSEIATLEGDVSMEETAVRTIALAKERFGSVDTLASPTSSEDPKATGPEWPTIAPGRRLPKRSAPLTRPASAGEPHARIPGRENHPCTLNGETPVDRPWIGDHRSGRRGQRGIRTAVTFYQ